MKSHSELVVAGNVLEASRVAAKRKATTETETTGTPTSYLNHSGGAISLVQCSPCQFEVESVVAIEYIQ